MVEIDLGGEARLVGRSARVGSLAAMVDPPHLGRAVIGATAQLREEDASAAFLKTTA